MPRTFSVGLPRSLCSLAMTIRVTVFASNAKQSPGRVEVYGVYVAYFFSGIATPAARNDGKAIVQWDISLALNMTYYFLFVIAPLCLIATVAGWCGWT